MMFCGSCRIPPPEQVCKACLRKNKQCTMNCRQARVYDTRITVKKRALWLRKEYTNGTEKGLIDFVLVVPNSVKKAFNDLFETQTP